MLQDIRTSTPFRTFYGPHIAGDSLDISRDKQILTGSWRQDNPLELWDFSTGHKIKDIPWYHPSQAPSLQEGESKASTSQLPTSMLYSARFSPDCRYIAAGGSTANEMKLFDHTAQGGDEIIGTVTGLIKPVFSVEFSNDSKKLAVAGGDSLIRVYDLN